MKKRSKCLKLVGLSLAGLSAVASSAAVAHTMEIESTGGLMVINKSDPCYYFAIHGRVDADEVIFSGSSSDKENNYPSGANLRHVLLGLGGGLGSNLLYKMNFDFKGNLVVINKAWLGWNPYENAFFRVGQITPLCDFDGVTDFGDAELTYGQIFMESALDSRAFSSRFRRALGVIGNFEFCDMFTLGATVYLPEFNVFSSTNQSIVSFSEGPRYILQRDLRKSDKIGEAIRITFSPIHDCDKAVHFGVLARNQSLIHTNTTLPDGGDWYTQTGSTADTVTTFLFSTFPEARARNTFETYDVGPIRAKNMQHYEGEVALMWGPLHFEAEYNYALVHRKPRNGDIRQQGNVDFHGYHVQAGYVLTGESRFYDFGKGTFLGIRPCGPCGAVELVARYSFLNLIDKDIWGGSGNNVTLGVNWFVNDNVRLMANYIRATFRPTAGSLDIEDTFPTILGQPPARGAKRRLDILGARFQWVF